MGVRAPNPAGRAPGPHEILIVGWFPAADEPITGRFVADQVAALVAAGRFTPSVVSFEPLGSGGDRALRTQAAEVWPPAVAAAVASGRAVLPSAANGPPGVPMLRLGVTGGTIGTGAGEGGSSDNQAVHRARALAAFLSAGSAPAWPLIHAHVGYPEGAAVAQAAGARGIPFVLTEHASYLARILQDPLQRAAYGRCVRAAARVIAVGRGLADEIVVAFPELRDRLMVIPDPVDLEAFPLADQAARRTDELLFVGYRTPAKGLDTLLAAFARVHAARPTTTLRLVGRATTDALEAGWQRRAAELGIADAVRFEPATDRAGVARAMAQAALFVHPSPRETFGVVAVEALATGLPVVATDSGGVTEILGPEPGRFGALVPPADPVALAAAITATLAQRTRFDPAVLRAWVAARYGAPAVAARLADLYDEVLADRPAGVAAGLGRPHPRRPAAHPAQVPGGIVVVAFDRPALDQAMARMPPWVVADTTIVTRGSVGEGLRVVDGALDALVAQLLAWADRTDAGSRAGPKLGRIRALVRARRRARLERRVLPALRQVVREAAAAARQGHDGPVWLVCLGGLDVLAATGATDARTLIAPGGLRWLGDLRWRGDR